MKIRKGDNIIMLSGKDKGKRAKVLSVLPEDGKVVVEGLNKALVTPATYIVRSPFTGAYRGVQGHNTPLAYKQLAETYPHEGELTLDGKNPILSWRFDDDIPANIGFSASAILGSITASVPWLVTRSARALVQELFYEIPTETYRTAREVLEIED